MCVLVWVMMIFINILFVSQSFNFTSQCSLHSVSFHSLDCECHAQEGFVHFSRRLFETFVGKCAVRLTRMAFRENAQCAEAMTAQTHTHNAFVSSAKPKQCNRPLGSQRARARGWDAPAKSEATTARHGGTHTHAHARAELSPTHTNAHGRLCVLLLADDGEECAPLTAQLQWKTKGERCLSSRGQCQNVWGFRERSVEDPHQAS